MRIAFNPSTVAALTAPPDNKDITFDLRGRNIFARGVKFCGTDTNTWRDIKINNVSIDSNTLDLRDGDNTTLTNINGVVTINSTWRPVVDNLTSDSTTSSLSANQGRVLKALIDGKSDSGHNHDDRYLRLTGGTMASNALITFADSGSWGTDKGPQGAGGGLYWTGQSDYAKLYAEETAGDNLDLVIQFGDDNSNGLSIRNNANTQTSYISAGGVITTGTFKGNLDWSYITNKPATATRWPSWDEITNKPNTFTPSDHNHDGRYLRYEGRWNDGSGQNVNDSLGMNFTYTSHGAPHHWGTTVTFECERGSSYRLQLHGTGDNYLYFRNRSADYGGWHSSGWKQILTNQDTYVTSDGTNRGIINGVEVASTRHLLINGTTWNSDWHWSGQGGQPSWLWGSNDGINMYVWNPSNFSVNYAASAGNADTLDGYHYNQLPYIQRLNWWNAGDSHNANDLLSGTTFAYSTHSNCPTTGTIVAFNCINSTGYPLQLQGKYYGEELWFRNRNGDNGTWQTWRELIHSGNIGSQSVNYASSAGNADTVDRYHATDGRTFTGNINWSENWNDVWSDGTHTHPWYGFDHRYPNTGIYSTTISDYYGLTLKTCNVYISMNLNGNVGIGYESPSYKLDVNGQVRASGFHHGSVNSDNYMLLAGGGYKSFGGNYDNPIFLGYLNLDHGNDGTVSSSFQCLGYSVSFTYTRGGNYCKIYIPDTSYQTFYIRAAIASVNYSGGGMDTWTGYHRGAGAWWLHCYAYSPNEVRVKGFRLANDNNDSWWGGNPLWSSNGGANRITVCIFGYVTFK